jgi:hypothetical protein
MPVLSFDAFCRYGVLDAHDRKWMFPLVVIPLSCTEFIKLDFLQDKKNTRLYHQITEAFGNERTRSENAYESVFKM